MPKNWIDLSQPFYEGMPYPASIPRPEIITLRRSGVQRTNVMQFTFATHVGTHIDAPLHFIPNGRTIDEIPLKTFAGEAVVFDVRKTGPDAITIADCERSPMQVLPEGIVLFYTGWGEKSGSEDYYSHPYLSVELAELIIDMKVKMIGIDVMSVDLPGPLRKERFGFPVHMRLLSAEIVIIENLLLQSVAGQKVMLVAFPVKITSADGAPARVVAYSRDNGGMRT